MRLEKCQQEAKWDYRGCRGDLTSAKLGLYSLVNNRALYTIMTQSLWKKCF